jgi:hypothetical protein
MKKFLILFTVLSLLFSFEAIAQKKDKKTKPAMTTTTTKSKTYVNKSGKVVYKVDFMGDQTQTLYWDDYGAKEARYTVVAMEILGQKSKSESVEINIDGYKYNFDLEKKTGTKSKSYGSIGGAKGMPSDISKMAQKEIEKMKIVDLGTKEVLGKTCKGLQMEPMGMKMEAWTWNNLLMESKTWLSKDGAPMTMNASSLELDISVPPEIFKVPEDIKITDR